ncbi:MAG TPA: hypothetical protein PKY78_07670 [Candidatus Omnitrophota bacterium]|nr:hypothetical protein [Candidatus Omnitrophota bacterium]HPS20845.1 hypothetical protein [Candidatus Omnitrophota bacterium]
MRHSAGKIFQSKQNKNLVKIFIVNIAVVALVVFGVLTVSFACLDKIVVIAVKHLTGCSITYKKWGDHIFDKSHIYGLNVEITKHRMVLSAGEAMILLNYRESLAQKKIVFDCRFSGGRLYKKSINDSSFSPTALMKVVFSPDWEYDSIAFVTRIGANMVNVDDFSAISTDMHISGRGGFIPGSNEVTIDVDVVFSPKMSEELMGKYKDMFLTARGNGWYGSKLYFDGDLKNRSFEVKTDFLDMNIKGR